MPRSSIWDSIHYSLTAVVHAEAAVSSRLKFAAGCQQLSVKDIRVACSLPCHLEENHDIWRLSLGSRGPCCSRHTEIVHTKSRQTQTWPRLGRDRSLSPRPQEILRDSERVPMFSVESRKNSGGRRKRGTVIQDETFQCARHRDQTSVFDF